MIEIECCDNVDLAHLGEVWRDLESRSDGSFFQSWAWVGCLAAERFPDPVLLQARQHGAVLALGLCNRRRRRGRWELLLNESGDPDWDAVFVEHNGFLVARDRPDDLITLCLRALANPLGRKRLRRHRLILSGVPDSYIPGSAAGPFRQARDAARLAPFVDLRALRLEGREYLDRLSGNTRYQLKRSRRHFAELGRLSLRRAGSVAEACEFLRRLAALHQKYWVARGAPGAFANPRFGRFHRTLIERAFPTGGIELLQIAAGNRVLGYLYGFRYRGTVYAYQSGFDYALAGAQLKPGLTAHHLAIEHYLRQGLDCYDLLAGAQRFKLSLATAAATLHWLEFADLGEFRPWQALTGALAATRRRRLAGCGIGGP